MGDRGSPLIIDSNFTFATKKMTQAKTNLPQQWPAFYVTSHKSKVKCITCCMQIADTLTSSSSCVDSKADRHRGSHNLAPIKTPGILFKNNTVPNHVTKKPYTSCKNPQRHCNENSLYCYRSGDLIVGQRNYTYMDAVKANLGGVKVKICGLIQYVNLFGVAIGYTIAASVSMLAIKRSNCFHKTHKKSECHMSSNGYMIAFGIIEILFSQIPDFDQVWWLSIVAAIMSFTYSIIGLTLGIAQVAENKSIKGSLTGISIGAITHAGTVTPTQKMWRSLQALGAIAFAYSYSIILIEIQDTIKSPPAEHKTMKKATTISIAVTTIFYLLCGCMGYAAFGDQVPGNLLTGFGFFDPYWLLDIANISIVIHLVGAYQVYCQPLFAFVEKWSAKKWSRSSSVTAEHDIPIPFCGVYKLNFFRVVWRTCFVLLTTLIAMLMPFFNDVVGILGALGFWPLTVYFPVEMYIAKNKIGRWTNRWIGLQMLSMACLVVSVAAAIGSVAGVVLDLQTYKPFKTSY